MANYIDPKAFHREMSLCKKNDILSNKAIEYFSTLANEVVKLFYFEDPEESQDAVANSIKDFILYWRNFKEDNLIQLKLNKDRNFIEGEIIEIEVFNTDKKVKFTAREKELKSESDFLIGSTVNKSLENLRDSINTNLKEMIVASLHKVTYKINIIDIYNKPDPEAASTLNIYLKSKVPLLRGEKDAKEKSTYKFETPPDSFKFYTSLARNGIIKYINDNKPEEIRNGKLIRFGSINSDEDSGFYNI
jgi:hypothetical protein